MRFRPCIDLRDGAVVQIVGASLGDAENPRVNHVSPLSAAQVAQLYAAQGLSGGHVIALGPGNRQAARAALGATAGAMQYGGGVNLQNAAEWLDAGASHVVVTSWVFTAGELDHQRLQQLARTIGADRLVLDLSCRWQGDAYHVVTDRWQRFTATTVDPATLHELSTWCAEFLIHGVDVEGLRQGVDSRLLEILGQASTHCDTPITYAGGIRGWEDLHLIEQVGGGRIDFTIGTALDLFGGPLPWLQVADRYR